MKVSTKIGNAALDAADVLVLPLSAGTATKARKKKAGEAKAGKGKPRAGPTVTLPRAMEALDRSLGGVVTTALAVGDFRGRLGQTSVLYPPSRRAGSTKSGAPKVVRVILVGLGAPDTHTTEAMRRAAGSAVKRASATGARRISLVLPELEAVSDSDGAHALVEGTLLGGYRFDRYRGNASTRAKSDKQTTGLQSLTLYREKCPARTLTAIRRATKIAQIIAESQNLARDLSNEPGNELPPAELAKQARKVARETGLRCRVMEVAELKRLKMGGVLAVGQGSTRPPRVIVLEHGATTRAPRGRAKPTICIIGKGITFDSGGISIKPAGGMEDMKHDMGGAAAVIGAMRAIALLDLPLHVVAVVASAENMPSGSAYRPGDIVRSHSGKTIEILNTDAEGRIVLADALHYARTKWNPVAMVDLATLTGACMVALGPWASGLLGNDADLIEKVRAAGDACGEVAWPLPLFDEHRKAMSSTVADVKNSGGRYGGASTAAGFLSEFVGDTAWVHLDIAGTGWNSPSPYQPKGGTGVGVRLIVELLRSW